MLMMMIIAVSKHRLEYDPTVYCFLCVIDEPKPTIMDASGAIW